MAEQVKFGGPFKGCISSIAKHLVPPAYLTGSSVETLIDPYEGSIYARAGTAIINDTFNVGTGDSTNGLLESKWGAIPRRMYQIKSDVETDGYPTYAVLYSKDAALSTFPATDSGNFGTVYIKDSRYAGGGSPDGNFQLLKDYGTTHYPADGNLAATSCDHIVIPYWYDSGEGGYARGVNQIQRQFIAAGSRSLLLASDNLYLPNLYASPMKWCGTLWSQSTDHNRGRWRPTGPMPPIGKVVATTPASTGTGSWTEGDTFFVSIVFVYKDGQISQPMLCRYPGTTSLTAGLNFLTITHAAGVAGTTQYPYTTYSNIPKGFGDVVERQIWRTPKVNTAVSGGYSYNLVNINDFRYVGSIKNNTQTSYVDYQGDDSSLVVDTAQTRFRWDMTMPRRARHIGTGDQRAIAGYTLQNPAAIIFAPYGKPAGDGTMNLNDTDTALYTNGPWAFRITETAGTTDTFNLHYSDLQAANRTALTVNVNRTIQDVVDQINATVAAAAAQQWVAQVAPGCDGELPATALLPTQWTIANCSWSNGGSTITTTSDFSNIPLGYFVYDSTGKIGHGTWVTAKASATSLTINGAATGAGVNVTLNFYAYTGDGYGGLAPWAAGGFTEATSGIIRAFGPGLPAVAYLRRSFMNDPSKPDKQSVYFTISSPGANNSGQSLAPDMWGVANRRIAPSRMGNCMGIADIEGAALVVYARGTRYFLNVRGVNSGEDYDYRLMTGNEHRGCISEKGLVWANGWAAFPTLEGFIATDKSRMEKKFSNAHFNPTTSTGALANEIARSRQAAVSDDDGSFLYASVLGTQLHVCYRFDTTLAYTDQRLVYDFGPGEDAGGLVQLFRRENGEEFGWSAPLGTADSGTVSCLTEIEVYNGGTRQINRYGAIGTNGGSTGDGRLDQIDTGSTDNGTDVTATWYFSVIKPDPFTYANLLRADIKYYMLDNGSHSRMTMNMRPAITGAVAGNTIMLPSGSGVYSLNSWNRSVVNFGVGGRQNADCFEISTSCRISVNPKFWEMVAEFTTSKVWS